MSRVPRAPLVFAAAGQRDSARAYAGHVRRAWMEGEPEARRRLARLDSLVPPR